MALESVNLSGILSGGQQQALAQPVSESQPAALLPVSQREARQLYSPQQQQQQQGDSISPSQALDIYKQFAGGETAGAGAAGGGFGGSGIGFTGAAGGGGAFNSAFGANAGLTQTPVFSGIAAGELGGAGATSGALGGGGAAGGAGGGAAGGGGLAAAGPWAALAAVIAINEEEARKGGFRADSRSKRLQDQLSGRVLSQDVDQRWIPQFAGSDKFGLGGDSSFGANLAGGNFSEASKALREESTIRKAFDEDPIAKLLKGLF